MCAFRGYCAYDHQKWFNQMVSLPALGLVLPIMVMYMYIQAVITMFTHIINCCMYFPECPNYKHSIREHCFLVGMTTVTLHIECVYTTYSY